MTAEEAAEFIAGIRASEREECARVIERAFMEARDTDFDLGFETARKVFAAAVRSRQ